MSLDDFAKSNLNVSKLAGVPNIPLCFHSPMGLCYLANIECIPARNFELNNK